MKKIFVLLCIPALVFAFSACGGNGDQASSGAPGETTASEGAAEDAISQSDERSGDMPDGAAEAASNAPDAGALDAAEVPNALPGGATESANESADEIAAPVPMSLSSPGVAGGTLGDAYGMRGSQQDGGVPTLSPPLSVQNAPSGTVCYAILMLDPDSKPLCGYEWTHWLAAGVTTAEIAENASVNNAADMTQGKNDFGALGYGGPTPPDKPHTYKITVYALDANPDLKNGFSKDELLNAINGHILAQATLDAKYGN
jgi:Raf kinase inhibitor-like YbhB/YbcL family protein